MWGSRYVGCVEVGRWDVWRKEDRVSGSRDIREVGCCEVGTCKMDVDKYVVR